MSKGAIKPEEARFKANFMKNIASELNEVLNDIDAKMQLIDNEDERIYSGSVGSASVRAEFDAYRKEFYKFSSQVEKYATDVEQAATRMLSQ